MGNYKSSKEVVHNTTTERLSLALYYIEMERQMHYNDRKGDKEEVARLQGVMDGILRSSSINGMGDLYSKTISDLRFAIQEENKEYRD